MNSETGDQPLPKRALEKGMLAAFGVTPPERQSTLEVIHAAIAAYPRTQA